MAAFESLADVVVWLKALQQKVNDLGVVVSPEAVRYIGDAGQPAFANGWVNNDNGLATPGGGTQRDAGFYRHQGRVYLTGIMKSGTANVTAFTLPVGYRPPRADVYRTVIAGGSAGLVLVDFNGQVLASSAMGSPATYCTLDGVDFRHA